MGLWGGPLKDPGVHNLEKFRPVAQQAGSFHGRVDAGRIESPGIRGREDKTGS